MEEGNQSEEIQLERKVGTALEANENKLPSTEFVKVEKNLASLGFFTPSSKRTRNEKSKTITATVVVDGKRIEAKATIAPTALFGLPITADQDKWLALNKILADIQTREGQVTNPVSFSSAELLALLQIYKDSGKNYKDVSDWLDVMVGTTIISEGAVYFAGKKTFGKDVYHVFDRAVSFGKELPDGSIADKNYVWLSQWQLQNINAHHQLPIDLDAYRQLRNFITKALVPLLQVWLYATRDDGVFEKRYDELCQILNIRQWRFPSKIKEKLGPSLDELKQFGYLSEWKLEETSDKQGYKILFFHGEKFHSDRRARLSRKQKPDGSAELKGIEHPVAARQSDHRPTSQPSGPREIITVSSPFFDPNLVAELTRRGITEPKAQELLAHIKPGQDVVAQLEYLEQEVERSQTTPYPIRHPGRFYASLIERNTPIPDGFETSAKRKAREEHERKEREARAVKEAEQQLQWEYDDYCERQVDNYIEANQAAFEAIKNAKWEDDKQKYSFTTESMAKMAARFEIRKQLPLPTFEEFLHHKGQGTDFSMKPVGVSPAPEPMSEVDVPVEPAPELTVEPEAPASSEVPRSDASSDTAAETPTMAAEREAANPLAGNPATEPAMPEPMPGPMMVELVSEPPPQEPDDDPIGQGLV